MARSKSFRLVPAASSSQKKNPPCGVPQVAGASGGSAEAVEHERTGFVIDPASDAVGAAAALKRILTDPALARGLADASRERAMADYSYDRLARDLEAGLAAWTP